LTSRLNPVCAIKTTLFIQGREWMSGFLARSVSDAYPNMPNGLVKRIVQDYLSDDNVVGVAKNIGFQHVARPGDANRLGDMLLVLVHQLLGASTVRSYPTRVVLISKGGEDAACAFVKKYFLVRKMDWETLLKVNDPEAVLNKVTQHTHGVDSVTRYIYRFCSGYS
jgi:dsRNA-specific ribonuclease